MSSAQATTPSGPDVLRLMSLACGPLQSACGMSVQSAESGVSCANLRLSSEHMTASVSWDVRDGILYELDLLGAVRLPSAPFELEELLQALGRKPALPIRGTEDVARSLANGVQALRELIPVFGSLDSAGKHEMITKIQEQRKLKVTLVTPTR